MKKILTLCISIILTIQSFSQLDINSLNEIDKKIVKTFRDIYVKENYKDPYSFELMKIETTPIKMGESYLIDIENVKSNLEKKNFKKRKTTEIKDLEYLNKLEKDYSQLNDSTKNLVRYYKVRIDSRGSNSFGGKILGKYSFDYYLYLNGLKPFNYNEVPLLFFVTELN